MSACPSPVVRSPAASPQGLQVPGVWPAAWAGAAAATSACPSGHAALDAVLAGGGWPLGALVEVLVPGLDAATGPLAGALVWPALQAALQADRAGEMRHAVLVDPPATPSVLAWANRGLPPSQWVQVQAGDPARRLWVCEQALACPAVGAVWAWLPHAPFQALRRLQFAAARHGGLLWVCRPLSARGQPSPAVLRLAIGTGTEPGQWVVQVFKQRGLAAPVTLQLALTDGWVQQLLTASGPWPMPAPSRQLAARAEWPESAHASPDFHPAGLASRTLGRRAESVPIG